MIEENRDSHAYFCFVKENTSQFSEKMIQHV